MNYGECTKCRRWNAVDAIFCSYCGALIYECCPVCKETEPAMFTGKKRCRKEVRAHKEIFMNENSGYFSGESGETRSWILILFSIVLGIFAHNPWIIFAMILFVCLMYIFEAIRRSYVDKEFTKRFPEEAELLANDRILTLD